MEPFQPPITAESLAPYLAEDNRRRGRIIGGVLTFWIVVSLLIDLVHYIPRGERYYLYLDLILLPVVVSFFLFSWNQGAGPTVRRRATFLFALFLLSWTAILTVFQGTPYTFFIFAFVTSATLLLPPRHGAGVYGAALAVYLLTLTVRNGSPFADGMTQFLEVLAMIVVACTVSLLLYQQRVRTIEAEERLRRKGEGQEREIASRTEDLNRRLAEREVLLREIHHRVKNNLQILASILRLSEDYRKEDDPEAFLKGAEQRILSMAMVHQQLYDTDNLEQVDLSGYLEGLSTHIIDSYQVGPPVGVTRNLERVLVPIDTAVNLGLLVTEALSNALRHAFPDEQSERRVVFSAETEGRRLIVRISDNGRGISLEKIEEEGNRGLGMVLIETLSDQLDGRVEYQCSGGTTLRFELSLPVN